MPIDQITSASIENASIAQVDLATGVAGTGPAFSAYQNATQNVTTGTWTKVQLNTEDFDTANCFDSTTNYRFTPNVAGYYQINAEVRVNGTSITLGAGAIYKNGTPVSSTIIYYGTSVSAANQFCMSKLIYFNGSTDYVELYGIVSATSPSFDYNSAGYFSRMNGTLVRGA
jgi:hypothetical protein